MKHIIILILFFSFKVNYSQTKILKKNINELNVKVEKLNLNIDSLKNNINNQILINKKLHTEITIQQKDLLFYKVKEDYYATAISTQATRFAIIVSGILALFTFISFQSFKSQVSKIKKRTNEKIEKVENEFIEYKDKLTKTTNDLTGAKANIYVSIAVYFRDLKNYESAFKYQLLAAKEHGLYKENDSSNDDSKEIDYKICITNLNLALNHLNINTIEKKKLSKERNKIKEIIDELNTLNNDEVKNITAEIRVLFNKKINVA